MDNNTAKDNRKRSGWVLGTDGSRYCRIGTHLYYEKNGRRGMLRDFSGKLYDGDRYVGDRLRDGIFVASDQTRIKPANDKIYAKNVHYVMEEDTLSTDEKVWFGITNIWDAMRIVLIESLQ